MDDEVFRALADSSRRTLLDSLFERDGQTLGELEAALPGMTRFGVMKHLRVLEAAGLVTSRKVGRERHHYLNPVPIRRIHDRWLDRYRIRAADLLDDLRATLEGEPMTTTDLAEHAAEAPPAHVFATFIRATPETIWRALTESEFTLRYYYRSTVESEWHAGSPYVYRIGGEPMIEGTILEADPPRRLVKTFHALWDEKVAADPPSRMTFEIEESAPGVSKLTVIHDGFERATETFGQVGGGWPLIMAGLKTLLETGQPLMADATDEEAHIHA
ncbi:MAG: SRPBCC domain-containing protein [Chloroflexota bacterium]